MVQLTPGGVANLANCVLGVPLTLQVIGAQGGGGCVLLLAHLPAVRLVHAKPSAPAGPTGAGIKRLQNPQAQQDRYRILVSDGEYSHSCMLATQLANLVHSGELVEGTIFELTDYISNSVQNKK